MTVCPFPCLLVYLTVCLLGGSGNFYWLDLAEKSSEDGSWSNLDLIKF